MKKKVIDSTYPLVSSPAEVDVNGKFSTLNFEMFKPLQYNRGIDTGIDVNRLTRFKKLYENDEYFRDEIHLIVNKAMEIIDGHHHWELHKWLKAQGIDLPINFTITVEKEFNEGTLLQKIGAIARRNAITSKWDNKAHFDIATKLGLPLAIAIENIKAEFCKKYNTDSRMITPSRIFALLKSDKNWLNSGLVTVEDYGDESLIEVMKTDKFKKEFEFMIKIINYIVEWNKAYLETSKILPFNMIRAIMPMVWDNMLNMDKFLQYVESKENHLKFKGVSNTVYGCSVYAKNHIKKLMENY